MTLKHWLRGQIERLRRDIATYQGDDYGRNLLVGQLAGYRATLNHLMYPPKETPND